MKISCLKYLVVCLSVAVLLPGAGTAADNTRKGQGSEAKSSLSNTDGSRTADNTPRHSREREAAALAFVREHHPELVGLLQELRSKNRGEYQVAIRDLYRARERLEGVRERNPERHALEIEHWKLRSRIQLMAAKALIAPPTGPEAQRIESELQESLAQQAELQLRMLELERRQLNERLEKIDANIQQLQQNRDQHVDRRLKALMRRADRSAHADASIRSRGTSRSNAQVPSAATSK